MHDRNKMRPRSRELRDRRASSIGRTNDEGSIPVPNKTRKPPLTRRKVDMLYTLAAFAECATEDLGHTDFEEEHADRVLEGVRWISQLCRWYEEQHCPNSMKPTEDRHGRQTTVR